MKDICTSLLESVNAFVGSCIHGMNFMLCLVVVVVCYVRAVQIRIPVQLYVNSMCEVAMSLRVDQESLALNFADMQSSRHEGPATTTLPVSSAGS
jgi:preprotein translocase subunit SecY